MAFEGNSGQGILDNQIQSYEGPLRASAAVSLRVDQQDVRVVNASSGDYVITLPPVSQARGRAYFFLKTDSPTDSVLILPHAAISGSVNGGDSTNWDGSTGYDLDAQFDSILLYSTGDAWIAIYNTIA